MVSVYDCETWKRAATLQTELDCIYDLKVKNDMVICSGNSGIDHIRFDELNISLEKQRKLWLEDANAAEVYEDRLFAGGRTGTLGIIDLNNGMILGTIKAAHTDAIQALSASSRQLLASVGEDGNVNIWDLRSSSITTPVKVLQPFLHSMTKTKDPSKYLSCCSFRGDWIVTGGGPKTALWHLGSGEPSQVLELGDDSPLCSLSAEGRVLVGGSGGKIHQFQNNGTKISGVPVSSPLVYSIRESPNGYLFAAGNTNVIDVYRNYGHRIHQLIV